jgi:cytochrome c5
MKSQCLLLLAIALPAITAQAAAPTRPTPIRLHSVSVHLPASTATFPPGPGAEVAGKCLICHSVGMVRQQPKLSEAQWKAEIEKMRDVYGAPITDAEIAPLTTYMTRYNADQQTR